MMDYKRLLAGAMIFSMLAATATGCSDKKSSSDSSSSSSSSSSESQTEAASETSAESSESSSAEEELSTEASSEAATAPVPVEASGDNVVTFDDGKFDFATAVTDDTPDAAQGTLEVVDVQGNKMLKFTDSGTSCADKKTQKVKINAVNLIGQANLDKVDTIAFDVYADATASSLQAKDGSMLKAPGWIGGGGGTVIADGKTWYDFSEYSSEDYKNEMSAACHVEFKFLLASAGKKWSNEMTDANFLIMRWGLQNESNLYIDNIAFYDKDGNTIPLA